ncbi:hypothetical protein PTTG_29089 [Puccinia triticina 1-1 BBBD Race 1]|uniref:DDE_3 domain-containing protein n=1 Tax=Puccinia triticina (isolate 1-1 / race 1 (BBBD)) TaxID=630390 RepID=A0A180G6F4_PUCT1|nr:hypothetical protein PTTG_29089 [Puccinia triticina 1-1 BBBD Race 1]
MGFQKYDPGTKIATVCMIAQLHSRASVCNTLGFSISCQSMDRWMQLYHATQRIFIKELLRCKPGLFLDKLQERLYDETNTLLSLTTLHRNLVENMEITLKKANTLNIKKSLVTKHDFIERMASVPAEYLVFTGEFFHLCSSFISSIADDLLQTFSRSPKGTQANRTIIDSNSTCFTLLPAIGFNGILAVTVTDDNVKGSNFGHFLKYSLLLQMNRYPDNNSVLVLDNAKVHIGEQVHWLCENAGVKIVFLPTYTPELNPIEFCFSQVKLDLCCSQALVRCADPKWVIERTMYQVVSARLCQKLFNNAGYLCPDTLDDLNLHEFHFSE